MKADPCAGRFAHAVASLCFAACAGSSAAQVSSVQERARADAATNGTEVELTLAIGHARVLEAGDVRRIAVGNGKVLQATAIDKRQVLILPEAVGQSSLHLWPRQGPMRRYLINVVASDAARSLAEVQAMLGGASNLHARLVGETILIEGAGLDAQQAARVQTVLKRHPHAVDMTDSVGAERMIAMDVRMIEIKKSALQRIGVRWSGTADGPSVGIVGDFSRSAGFEVPSIAQAAGIAPRAAVSPFATALGIATSITSMLDFLVREGDAVILAEPRLSCRSGGTARFVAGGELPIPQSAGLGSVSVTFKEYGIKFDFSPTAGPNDTISARIATEVSAIDFETQVGSVPGLIKRRAETEVNLLENQTFVIAGLLTEDVARNVDRVAGLGEVPVLGRLFRSREFRSSQTDLVVFVTPRFLEAGMPPTRDPAVSERGAREQARRLRMVD